MTIIKFVVAIPNNRDRDDLSDSLTSQITDICITWLDDNCAVISTSQTLLTIIPILKKFKIKPSLHGHPEIKHRININTGVENIDSVLSSSNLTSL